MNDQNTDKEIETGKPKRKTQGTRIKKLEEEVKVLKEKLERQERLNKRFASKLKLLI